CLRLVDAVPVWCWAFLNGYVRQRRLVKRRLEPLALIRRWRCREFILLEDRRLDRPRQRPRLDVPRRFPQVEVRRRVVAQQLRLAPLRIDLPADQQDALWLPQRLCLVPRAGPDDDLN